MKYLVITLLISCSNFNIKIAPEFTTIVNNFLDLAGMTMPLGLEVVMDCTIESDKAGGYYHRIENKVHINCKTWYKGDLYQEMVMYHELGHAILGRIHESYRPLKGGCPDSMMFYAISVECYAKHRQEYIKELFSKFNDLPWARFHNGAKRINKVIE